MASVRFSCYWLNFERNLGATRLWVLSEPGIITPDLLKLLIYGVKFEFSYITKSCVKTRLKCQRNIHYRPKPHNEWRIDNSHWFLRAWPLHSGDLPLEIVFCIAFRFWKFTLKSKNIRKIAKLRFSFFRLICPLRGSQAIANFISFFGKFDFSKFTAKKVK